MLRWDQVFAAFRKKKCLRIENGSRMELVCGQIVPIGTIAYEYSIKIGTLDAYLHLNGFSVYWIPLRLRWILC